MKQTVKQLQSFRWVLALALTFAMFVGCNDAAKEEEKTTTPEVAAPVTKDTLKTDTLPVIDTNTVTKPDGGKTVPTQPAH